MRQKLLLLGLVAAAVSLPAMADDNYEDRGRVISVTPQVQRVNSRQRDSRPAEQEPAGAVQQP